MTQQPWTRLREAALDSVSVLKDLIADHSTEKNRLVAAYLETKQVLADAFEALAVENFYDPAILDNVKKQLERKMRESYPYLPDKYLKVRGFGDAHAKLLSYLTDRAGTEVSAAALRILTGDAVHTERRTRELRDLGFELQARHTGGSDIYTLCGTVPDLGKGAAILVARNIGSDKTIADTERKRLLGTMGQIQ